MDISNNSQYFSTQNPSYVYTIGGVKVDMPVKPYPSQVSMMDKVIRGCQKQQNCLLESPTGSGKTLALLCSALSWQKAEKERIDKIAEEEFQAKLTEWMQKEQEVKQPKEKKRKMLKEKTTVFQKSPVKVHETITLSDGDSDEEMAIFKQPGKKRKINNESMNSSKNDSIMTNDDSANNSLMTEDDEEPEVSKSGPPKKIKPKIPVIFFCTRTHKQISQVVKELKRTNFTEVKSCVLASREHMCIQDINVLAPQVKFKSKTEMCRELIDPKAINANLNGHVLIVDEAHNIEDQCRDAASLQLDQTNLNLAKMDCEKMSRLGSNSSEYGALAQYLSDLSIWIDKKSAEVKSYDDYNRGVISWSGIYTVASFNEFGLGLDTFEKFKVNCQTVLSETTDGEQIEVKSPEKTDSVKKKQEDMEISNATKQLLGSIITTFEFLFDEKYKNDYHVSLEKVMQVKKYEYNDSPLTVDGWINDSKESRKDSRTIWVNIISFLCLNPGAVFEDLKISMRSIILTSGTLSPMDSFQSELGTQFPIALEANHVIKSDQCWVTSVSTGPNQIDLNGQHQNTNTFAFQDEMGRVLKNVCETVPYGVLCFMPSYVLMDKLYERWQLTGMLKEISNIKLVLREPRRGDELEGLMYKYYNVIKGAQSGTSGRLTGALFMAVYRGKISEGLDFSDNNARAVVAVGIPFPNYKEVAVSHKKEYNNRHYKEKGLLNGWQWYEIQAYRALNQALGRCIRHRDDWGAILLVDSRYAEQKRTAGLSKWIRSRVERPESWSTVIDRLKFFIESRQNDD
ncbi:Fanconi anemia group J protein homolog isoform X2 [Daktulosphaira vitifoliae]|uniref:Fanconi anemia group J protein homolog isoform X2 n=1 Tax=Daktulosphaira vitifoliae TaxID=58002 RepID=UPI0021AA39F3|nr:Fanconi anemia group J protein homolog isoform X2 [Daktulosphaira vitifoliae]